MPKKKFRITPHEWLFVAVMTLLAILFTNKYWLLTLNKFNPIVGFLIYYVVVYASLTIMSVTGLIIFGVKIRNPTQIIGSGLIVFAFFLIFNWSSQYVALIGADNVFYNNSEDGLLWYLFSSLINTSTPVGEWVVWFITFPLMVFILVLIGVFLVHRKPRLGG